MTLLNDLLHLRETRFTSLLEILLTHLEASIQQVPYVPLVSLNANLLGLNDMATNQKLVELLIEGGLSVTLNVGLMNTTFEFDLTGIKHPTKTLDRRLSQYRLTRLNQLYKLLAEDLKKQIQALPSLTNITLDVYKITGISNQETTDYLVGLLANQGLEVKASYNTIQITLPDLSYKRPTYTLTSEQKDLLALIIRGEDIEGTVHGFLLAVFNYLNTQDREPIKSCLSYANVYAFMQTLGAEPIRDFLSKQELDIEEYKCEFSIPCSLEEWKHCDDLVYILKVLGPKNSFSECGPLYKYLLTQM